MTKKKIPINRSIRTRSVAPSGEKSGFAVEGRATCGGTETREAIAGEASGLPVRNGITSSGGALGSIGTNPGAGEGEALEVVPGLGVVPVVVVPPEVRAEASVEKPLEPQSLTAVIAK